MVDPTARAAIRAAVEDYLAERITAFEFDERLFVIETADATVDYVVRQLWFSYDDVSDHLVCADKQTWDWIQRLLLLLDSGAEVHTHSAWHWHKSQVAAAVCLLLVLEACLLMPPAAAIPVLLGGLVSLALSRWRGRARLAVDSADPWHAYPFPSLGALRQALARAPGFRKQRHRPQAAARLSGNSGTAAAAWLHAQAAQVMFSPVALLFQSLPLRSQQIEVSFGPR